MAQMGHVNLSAFAVAAVTALAFAFPDLSSASDAGTNACVQRVLREWRAGRVGQHHSVACFRAALATLPEDMQIYSDAPQQIQRALNARLTTLKSHRPSGVAGAQRTLEAAGAPSENTFPLPVLVAAAGFVLVVTIGFGLRLGHRLRGR